MGSVSGDGRALDRKLLGPYGSGAQRGEEHHWRGVKENGAVTKLEKGVIMQNVVAGRRAGLMRMGHVGRADGRRRQPGSRCQGGLGGVGSGSGREGGAMEKKGERKTERRA